MGFSDVVNGVRDFFQAPKKQEPQQPEKEMQKPTYGEPVVGGYEPVIHRQPSTTNLNPNNLSGHVDNTTVTTYGAGGGSSTPRGIPNTQLPDTSLPKTQLPQAVGDDIYKTKNAVSVIAPDVVKINPLDAFSSNTNVPYRYSDSSNEILIPSTYERRLSTSDVKNLRKFAKEQNLNLRFEDVTEDQEKVGGGLYEDSFKTYTGSTIKGNVSYDPDTSVVRENKSVIESLQPTKTNIVSDKNVFPVTSAISGNPNLTSTNYKNPFENSPSFAESNTLTQRAEAERVYNKYGAVTKFILPFTNPLESPLKLGKIIVGSQTAREQGIQTTEDIIYPKEQTFLGIKYSTGSSNILNNIVQQSSTSGGQVLLTYGGGELLSAGAGLILRTAPSLSAKTISTVTNKVLPAYELYGSTQLADASQKFSGGTISEKVEAVAQGAFYLSPYASSYLSLAKSGVSASERVLFSPEKNPFYYVNYHPVNALRNPVEIKPLPKSNSVYGKYYPQQEVSADYIGSIVNLGRITESTISQSSGEIVRRGNFEYSRFNGEILANRRYGNPITAFYESRGVSVPSSVNVGLSESKDIYNFVNPTITKEYPKTTGRKELQVIKITPTTTDVETTLEGQLRKTSRVDTSQEPRYVLASAKSGADILPQTKTAKAKGIFIQTVGDVRYQVELVENNAGLSQDQLKILYEGIGRGRKLDVDRIVDSLAQRPLTTKIGVGKSRFEEEELKLSTAGYQGDQKVKSLIAGRVQSLGESEHSISESFDVYKGKSIATNKQPKTLGERKEGLNTPYRFTESSQATQQAELPVIELPQEKPTIPSVTSKPVVEKAVEQTFGSPFSGRSGAVLEEDYLPSLTGRPNEPSLPTGRIVGGRVSSIREEVNIKSFNVDNTRSIDSNVLERVGIIPRERSVESLSSDSSLKEINLEGLKQRSRQGSSSISASIQSPIETTTTEQRQKSRQREDLVSRLTTENITPPKPPRTPTPPEDIFRKTPPIKPPRPKQGLLKEPKTSGRTSIRFSDSNRISRGLDVKADLISVNASQAIYGKATSPKATKQLLKTAGTRIKTPTIEIKKFANKFRKSLTG